MTGVSEFEKWYRSLRGNDEEETRGDAAQRDEAFLRRWFLAFYEAHGPAEKDVVETAFRLDELELATQNVAAIAPDIARSTGRHPAIDVDVYMGSVRISFNGNYTAPSVKAWENPEALVDVAGYIQEHMMDEFGIWPVCPEHDGQVLLPEAIEGQAVWRCRGADHTVAPIGYFGAF